MKITALGPMMWTEDLEKTIGLTCFEKNGDRGRTKLQFGREFEVI